MKRKDQFKVLSLRTVTVPDIDEDHGFGLWAEADVVVDGVIQVLRSGGLFGIDDPEPRYLKEVEDEEYASLKGILKSISVKKMPPRSIMTKHHRDR